MTGFVNVFAVLFLSTCIMVLSQFIFCKFFYYIFMLWFLSSSIYLLFFPAWSQRPHIGCLPYFVTWCGPSANLECRSETCCAWLGETAGPKKSPKIGHLGTIGQLCKATSSQLKHISTIEKKRIKQQYLLQMFSQYGELRPTSGWDRSGSLGHLCKFQRVSRLGRITARHCSSRHQPNFAALNRGHHLYSAGRPLRWSLTHISSSWFFKTVVLFKILIDNWNIDKSHNGGYFVGTWSVTHSVVHFQFSRTYNTVIISKL